MLLLGESYEQISEVTRRTPATLYNYSKAYREQGIKGLEIGHPPGRHRLLTAEQEKRVYHHFDGIISEERNLDKRNRNLFMLRERLKQKPDDIKIINAIASELRALHRYDEALEIAKKAMELDKYGTKRSFQGYAYTCCCAKKYNEAIEYSKIQIDFYQSAINNKSSRAALDSCNVIIAKSYLELNDIGKCEEILKKNIENNSELSRILWEQVSNKINCYTLRSGFFSNKVNN